MTKLSTFNTPKFLEVLGRPTPLRILSAEFPDKLQVIVMLIASALNIPRSRIHDIRRLDRPDYGDIDLVMDTSNRHTDWAKTISSKFENCFFKHISKTNITVFEINSIQVNIHSSDKPLGYSDFMAYNGAIIFLEIIAKSIFLKLNPLNLCLPVDIDDVNSDTIHITNDSYSIFGLLGINLEDYRWNVHTEEDLFTFIKNSRYFNRENFISYAEDPANESDTHLYLLKSFLIHLQNNPSVAGNNRRMETIFSMDSIEGKNLSISLNRGYPTIQIDYKKYNEAKNISNTISLKYNTKLVSELTKLEGDDIISFMVDYEDTFKDKDTFNLFILSSLPDTIKNSISKFYESALLTETPIELPVAEIASI